jgi:RNA polymerase sigma factor (TIGR02999 family)
MNEVTRILSAIEEGDAQAADQLLPLVYQELRKLAAARMAKESANHTLEATALVHEAFVRLVDADQVRRWDSRGHFFAAAAEAMRRILIESARRRNTLKRSGAGHRVDLDQIEISIDAPGEELLALDEALTRLSARDPVKAELVKLRFFAGLTIPQAAEVLGISSSTADNYWSYARAWLRLEMTGETPDADPSPNRKEFPG